MLRNSNFLSGMLFLLIGTAFGIGALNYRVGTPAHMGAGFLPLSLAVILALLGVAVVIGALRESQERFHAGDLRPLIVITAAMVAFALLLRPGGFVLASFVAVMLSSFAGPSIPLLARGLMAVLLSAVATIGFVELLGLPVSVWPQI